MTETLTFDQLPIAVQQLGLKLESIERLLLQQTNQTPAQAPDKLMTVHETAEFLGLQPNTVYSNVSKGLLPAMKQGNRLYFSRAELMEYVKAGRKLTVAETAAQANAYIQGKKKGGKICLRHTSPPNICTVKIPNIFTVKQIYCKIS